MEILLEGSRYWFECTALDELERIDPAREHIAIVDILIAEIKHVPFEQLYYTESTFRALKKSDIKGLGNLSQVELAVQLVKFIMYYDPEEVYNNEGHKRIRNQKGRSG